jgi:mitochondrial fission protein ELM1
MADRRAQTSIWVLASYRAGENSQLAGLAEALAERLQAGFEIKRMSYTASAAVLALSQRVTLAGLAPAARAALAPPWPDILISAGLKNEPAVRYIRAASGGRTRCVVIGRTWAPRAAFDLLITTPQYRVPQEPWVLHNLLTQHSVRPERLAAVQELARARFGHLPQPHIGVLLGGNSGPYVLGPANAFQLARQLEVLRKRLGGSLLVSTSSRTPVEFVERLCAQLAQPKFVYRFRPEDADNPYLELLASAAVLVVTGDSVAMLSEAAGTAKPVLVYDVVPADSSLRAAGYRWLMRFAPARLTRDVGLFHQGYMASGFGRWLVSHELVAEGDAQAELRSTLDRIAALLPDRGTQASAAAAVSSS